MVIPDIERLTRDVLADLMEDQEVTVGIGVPLNWSGASHLQVQSDGVQTGLYPVAGRGIVRIVAWSRSTTTAKRLAALAEARLLAFPGGDGITNVTPVAGVLPERDPDTRAELAAVTVAVTARAVPA